MKGKTAENAFCDVLWKISENGTMVVESRYKSSYPHTYMDTKTLVSLIQRSSLLSDPERDYWLRNLPGMSPKQCDKLWNILNVSDELPFQQELQDYFTSLGKVAEAAFAQRKAA